MAQVNVAEHILQYLDIAILKRVKPGLYELLGEPPSFYSGFFPPVDGEICVTPWAHSHMLEFFYEEAEDFFENGSTGMISSGLWEEEGLCEADQALIAEAISFNEAQVITVRLLKEVYTEHVNILRKAREQLLERRHLDNDLEKYKCESRIDGLTKVFNRCSFMELLPAHFTRAQDMDEPLSLIMLDIDHFKDVNDTYGHQAGDQVLSILAQLLVSRVRRDDAVGRYGGEEFIIMVPGTPKEHVARIAEKLRKSIAEYRFREKNLPPITISLGHASYQSGDTPETLIRRADIALYEAKRAGRNAVREG